MARYLVLLLIFISASFFSVAEAKDAQTCLDEALKLLDEEVDRRVDPELVALKERIEYPVKQPQKTLNEIFKEALRKVEKELNRDDVKTKEELFLEISKAYAPFELGQKITVTPNVGYKRAITGRYQGRNNFGHVHIGSRWIPLTDFDEDTAARFDNDKCDKLIKKKWEQAIRKQNIVLDSQRRRLTENIMVGMLKENGYVPKDPSKSSPHYLEMGNWESLADYLERKVKAEKDKLRDELQDDIVDKHMTKNGFIYDEENEVWRSPDEPTREKAPQPQQDKPVKKKPQQDRPQPAEPRLDTPRQPEPQQAEPQNDTPRQAEPQQAEPQQAEPQQEEQPKGKDGLFQKIRKIFK